MRSMPRAFLRRIPAGRPAWLVALAAAAWLTAAPLVLAATDEQAGRPKIELIDRIVAVVNSDIITSYDLNERLQRVRHDLQARNTPLPNDADLQRQILDR